MEARLVFWTTLLVLVVQPAVSRCCADQGSYRTANFVVTAPGPAFAKQVGDEAERFRRELAILWLGHELPTWSQPCPITVRVEPHAGGETSFAFVPDAAGGSRPIDWRMTVFGPAERILDSVLPHEVTHTIFATHFGRPLPRWADEGACTTVEHETERARSHDRLIDFLTTNRGIPFNHMFVMKQYPSDILPLYSQGHSLCRFLIMQRGHRHFVDFIDEGMQREVPGQGPRTWNEVGRKYYGYKDLSEMQTKWVVWVKRGCPRVDPDNPQDVALQVLPAALTRTGAGEPAGGESSGVRVAAGDSWYVRQSRSGPESPGSPSSTGQNAGPAYQPGSIGGEPLEEPSRTTTRLPVRPKTIWR